MAIVNPDVTGSTATVNSTRIQRKYFLTVVEWGASGSEKREVLGGRVDDSSLEFNPDVETTTDILGNTYADINKTEPQQDFDMSVLAGSELSDYLSSASLSNNIAAYNGTFTVYLIAMFMQPSSGTYRCVKHINCSLIPQSMGGSDWLEMPVELHLSNNLTMGTVAAGSDGKVNIGTFTFTAASTG